MADPLPPGSVIGILGGGQLGRMLALSAAELGFDVAVLDPDPDAPAARVARHVPAAAFDDQEALARLADIADVVTYEFENVPESAVAFLETRLPVRPGRRALAVSQDRLAEKTFLRDAGLATAPFAVGGDVETLIAEAERVGFSGILKTRRLGYDGKGQSRITDGPSLRSALGTGDPDAVIYEGVVRFAREVSVIAVRSADGSCACFDVAENVHHEGILRTSSVPVDLAAELQAEAKRQAARIAGALDYIGVLGVEFFHVDDAADYAVLVVNEFAPRVHNSGHWTQDACAISQFDAHICAVAGWPVPVLDRHHDAVMTNLIGDDVEAWRALSAEPGARLHLYGKRSVRPGRKMGHVTRLAGPAKV